MRSFLQKQGRLSVIPGLIKMLLRVGSDNQIGRVRDGLGGRFGRTPKDRRKDGGKGRTRALGCGPTNALVLLFGLGFAHGHDGFGDLLRWW